MFETFARIFKIDTAPTYTRSDDYLQGADNTEQHLRLVIRDTDFKLNAHPRQPRSRRHSPPVLKSAAPANHPLTRNPRPVSGGHRESSGESRRDAQLEYAQRLEMVPTRRWANAGAARHLDVLRRITTYTHSSGLARAVRVQGLMVGMGFFFARLHRKRTRKNNQQAEVAKLLPHAPAIPLVTMRDQVAPSVPTIRRAGQKRWRFFA